MNDPIATMFTSDETAAFEVNAAQGPRSLAAQTPEARLLLHVLTDAFDCLSGVSEKSGNHIKLRAIEAREWIESNESEDLFSFVNICQIFNFDAAWLRKGILAKAPQNIRLTEYQRGRPLKKPTAFYNPRPERRCSHYDTRVCLRRQCSGANLWRCYCCSICRPGCGKISLDIENLSA